MSDTQHYEQPAGAPPPPAPEGGGGAPYRGGTIIGILLVLAGMLFLGGRYVPWMNIANAWPLIIVALGLVSAFRGGDVHAVLDGLTTVIVGGILLANTTGYLSWDVWVRILSLWPLLLVAAGIAIIGRAVSQSWLRVVAQLVIMGGLLYGALLMPAPSWSVPPFVTSIGRGPMATFSDGIQQGSDEATVTRGAATVQWGASRIDLRDGSAIMSMSGNAPVRAQPKLTRTASGSRIDVSIAPEGSGGAGPSGHLDVALGRDVTWERIAVQTGASSGRIDLSRLEVEEFQLDTGASDTTIIIGEESPRVAVRVNAGVASVTLRVPKDAAVSVHVTGPVASDLPSGFRAVDGDLFDRRWEGGPSSATMRVDAVVNGGIANINVETY